MLDLINEMCDKLGDDLEAVTPAVCGELLALGCSADDVVRIVNYVLQARSIEKTCM